MSESRDYCVAFFDDDKQRVTGGYGTFTYDEALRRANDDNRRIAEAEISGGGFYFAEEHGD